MPLRAQPPLDDQPALDRDIDVFRTLTAEHNNHLGIYCGVASPGVVRLGDGEVPLWQALFEHLVVNRPEAASAPFMEAALRREETFAMWQRTADRAASACESYYFATVSSALRPWRPWFFEGLARVRPADHPLVLDARFEVLRATVPDDGGASARSLAADVRRACGEGPKLGHVLLLVHRRVGEAGDHEGALAAATEAERLFAQAGEAADAAWARRLCGCTLLRLARIDEAFALLDP